jgi:WD40 repeat protein/transcriptional regulator CtsR
MEHEKEKTSGVLILPWFVGASARSTGVTNLLGDYCATLARECNIADDIPGDPIELKKAFVEFLKKANRKVVILLDAVNQLRDGVQNGRVSWLPDELPENVCVLFSLVEDLRGKDGKANIEADKSFLEATRKRRTPSHEIKVKKLTEVEKQEIVASYLRQYNKNLSQDQKTKIVGKGESYNPLFLQVALEELRMVSRYEEVDSFISSGIKQTAEEMLGQTLERVEQEMEQRYPEEGCELFRRFMVLIAVGRNGMTEEDLRLLLGDWKGIDKNAGKEEKKAQVNAARLPDLKWSELRRSMRSYLFLSGDYWNFFHQQIKQAVEARYLDSEDKRREAHAEIAEYLTVMGYEHGTTARDLPYHLKQTEKTDELRAVLLTFKWTYEKLKAANVDELIVDYNLLDEREIKLMKSAIITSAHVLRHDFRQLPCQMYGRLLSYTADLWIGAFLNDIERWKEFPWLKPINICLAQAGGPLIRTLVGHKDYIVSVCITPDGKKVISSSQNDTLKVWDIDTGEELRTIVGLRHNVNCVKITPDGRIVISASDGKGVDTLKMWDIDTGEELWTAAGHCSNVKSLSITPDGKKAISESDNILIVWDIESGITLRTLRRCDFYNFGVCITPDGKRAVSKLNASALMVWNVDSGRKIRSFDGHDDEHVISSVCITPDGEKAIFVIGVNNIKFWDLNTGKDLKTLAGYRDGVDGLFVTPDGKYFIAISRNNTMDVWDLKTWTKINTLTGHSERISKVCITPDAKKAVSASWDHTLKVWDIENGELIMTLAGHGAWVTDVCTTLDGKIAVSASWDKTLKVWDINSREKNLPLAGHGNRVSGICITPDGKKAVSASWDNTLKVWDIETGIEVRSLVGHHDRITSVSITPDGERAITASDDHTLKIWNIDSGKEIRTLTGHNDRVRSLCITPDGKKAISASNSIQEHLIVWDIETGGMIRDFGGSNRYNANVSISPDGKNAITLSDDGDPEVREIETGKMVSEFELRDLYYKAKVNLYPAMKMAISITDDTLTVWDTDRVKVIRTIKGKNGYFGDACITPDGMRVVSASSDNTLNISDIETGEILISFIGENSLCSCQTTLDGSKIIAGDQGGKIYFLEVECTI